MDDLGGAPVMGFEEAVRNGQGGVNEDTAVPLFYTRAIRRTAKSEAAGRDIFEDIPYVRIVIPGQYVEAMDTPVTEEHRLRWPDQWKAFEANQEQPTIGTPLESCRLIRPEQIATLKTFKVMTVDALVCLPDPVISKLGREYDNLRNDCRKWLQGHTEMVALGEKVERLEEEAKEAITLKGTMQASNERLTLDVAKLEERNAELKKELDEAHDRIAKLSRPRAKRRASKKKE